MVFSIWPVEWLASESRLALPNTARQLPCSIIFARRTDLDIYSKAKEFYMTKNPVTKKTDALTLRLNPKIKYLIELCSRTDRTTITGVIENAVHMLASKRTADLRGSETSLLVAIDFCWSPDECERVVNLIFKLPSLLTHEESCIRSVIFGASDIFLNPHEVRNQQDYDYRSRFSYRECGAFCTREDGETLFVSPRRKTIKLAWGLIRERAADLAETGSHTPLTQAEVEAYIGKPLSSIRPSIKAQDDGYDDQGGSVFSHSADAELDDTIDNLTGKN
jgi:hypothetical protein